MNFYCTFLLLIFMVTANAQNLDSHRWDDRVILVLSDDVSNEEFKEQIKVLQENTKGLEERKLVVYQVLPGKFRKGLKGENEWILNKNLYQKYNPANLEFKVILIGLDGGLKLQEEKLLPVKTIFSTIDSMPMRQAEMKRKKNDSN